MEEEEEGGGGRKKREEEEEKEEEEEEEGKEKEKKNISIRVQLFYEQITYRVISNMEFSLECEWTIRFIKLSFLQHTYMYIQRANRHDP